MNFYFQFSNYLVVGGEINTPTIVEKMFVVKLAGERNLVDNMYFTDMVGINSDKAGFRIREPNTINAITLKGNQ